MVFYFTGTGNSLYVVKRLEDKPISIPQIIRNETLEFTADVIGIVVPIYGYEMPPMVKEFVQKAVFHADYFYIILTYGTVMEGHRSWLKLFAGNAISRQAISMFC